MSIRKSKSGFTLVEILIVVIILGILAAIVIPQFTNASQDARRSSLMSQLQTLRSQIELFKLQHGDALPNIVGGGAAPGDGSNWVPMTTITNYGGNPFGPYMQSVPVNPLNGNSNVEGQTVLAGDPPDAAAAAVGFVYDYAGGAGTGRIWGTDTDAQNIFAEN